MALAIVLAILVVDQIIKIWVKTHMSLHETIHVTDWFYINFVENNGMAYGMTIGPKLLLSVFRIVVVTAICVYLYRQVKQGARWLYVVLLAMVIAGAIGNIIDSMFYGLVFSESTPYDIARWVTFGDGYAPFLKGKVVDMFYFPLIDTYLPDWLPFFGGDHFLFFAPVFNFADSAISVAVILLLLLCRKELKNISFSKKTEETEIEHADIEEKE